MLGRREFTDYETEFYVRFTSIGCSIEIIHLFSILAVTIAFAGTPFATAYILATPAIILLLPLPLLGLAKGRRSIKSIAWTTVCPALSVYFFIAGGTVMTAIACASLISNILPRGVLAAWALSMFALLAFCMAMWLADCK
jgi:hypothetical protein